MTLKTNGTNLYFFSDCGGRESQKNTTSFSMFLTDLIQTIRRNWENSKVRRRLPCDTTQQRTNWLILMCQLPWLFLAAVIFLPSSHLGFSPNNNDLSPSQFSPPLPPANRIKSTNQRCSVLVLLILNPRVQARREGDREVAAEPFHFDGIVGSGGVAADEGRSAPFYHSKRGLLWHQSNWIP